MRIFLTGGRGFIGSTWKERTKHEFFDFKDNTINLPGWKFSPKTDDCDLILHLGAEAGVRRSHEEPDLYYEHNVIGFDRILERFPDKKILYASSSSIYEWWLSPYATTKKMNEAQALRHENSLGLRFHTVYGKNSRSDMLFDQLVRGHRLDYITNHQRDYTHVNDVCDAIDICIDKFNLLKQYKAIDVGNGTPVSIRDLVQHFSPEQNPEMKAVTGEREITCADPTILKQHGWRPQHFILDERIEDYAEV